MKQIQTPEPGASFAVYMDGSEDMDSDVAESVALNRKFIPLPNGIKRLAE